MASWSGQSSPWAVDWHERALRETGGVLTPTSTYRLQITSSRTSTARRSFVPYIRRLGADWVYLSPILRPRRLPTTATTWWTRRGGPRARWLRGSYGAVRGRARRGPGRGGGRRPNHQGVAEPQQNPLGWWSLLAEGRESRFSRTRSTSSWEAGHGKVLIRVLGDGDEGPVRTHRPGRRARYYENVYPLADGTWSEGETAAEVHGRQRCGWSSWRGAIPS
ncbi:hypothetical protein QJS66_20680 [Kocuria rhizophila]|nr:hypothetical protein QJS66_20680 [Kocuria rhizophila]